VGWLITPTRGRRVAGYTLFIADVGQPECRIIHVNEVALRCVPGSEDTDPPSFIA
jgi:hypothetical protein